MTVLTEILDVVATYIEYLLGIVVGFCFLEKSQSLHEKYFAIVVGPIIPVGILILLDRITYFDNFKVFYFVIAMIGTLAVIYRERWYKNIGIAVTYFIILIVCDLTVGIVMGVCSQETFYQAIYGAAHIRIIGILVSKMLLISIVIGLMRFKVQRLFQGKRYWSIYIFTSMAMLLMTLYVFFSIMNNDDNDPLFKLGIVFIMFSIIFIVLLETIISKFSIQEQEELEIQLLSSHNQTLVKAIKEQQCKAESERQLRHDFNNILIGLQNCLNRGNLEELKAIMSQMMGKIETAKYVKLQNKELEVVMNQKLAYANQLHIEMEVNIDFPEQIQMNMFDICVLFGNVLDNAIENAKGTQEAQIHITIKKVKTYYIMRMMNTYHTVPRRTKEGFLSIKTGDNHGIGLKSIQRVVMKYQGTLETTYDERWFTLNIMFPEKELEIAK